MRNTKAVLSLIAVAAMVGSAFGGPALAERPGVDRSMMPSGGAHGRSEGGDDVDRAFVKGMVPHHQAAVDMARVEIDKGKNADVKALARSIAEDQEREIAQMSELAEQKWGFRPETQRKGPMGVLMGVLVDMPISMDMSTMAHHLAMASDVDRMFLQMMIPHHGAAISMADEEHHRGADRKLMTMAQTMITAQAREIGQMETMLRH